jgi:hypothetical protein
MTINRYVSQTVKSEQNLYEDIIIESLQFYGQDVYYIPRDLVNEDQILGHDISSRFNSSYIVEMYIENVNGFDGEGDLFTKFGIEIRDQATFVVSRKRWKETVQAFDNEINSNRPREGDLLFLPLSGSIFQIMHVQYEEPFYQISNLPTYKLRCELFEYAGENLDTGIDDIDRIEREGYRLHFDLADSAGEFIVGETLNQTLGNGTIMKAEVVVFDDFNDFVQVTHIGSDDSDFTSFTTGAIVGATSGTTRTVTSITEILDTPNAQNNDFTNEATPMLDFTERNPFGEPE